jgi:hypothetical protein
LESRTAHKLILLFAATMVVSCVDLRKPKVVDECATAGNCSDDPSQHPKPDANEDVELAGPDLPHKDEPAPQPDAAPEAPGPDAAADTVDTRDGPGADSRETADVTLDDGLPPADAGPDSGSDGLRRDLGPDLGSDAGADLRPDLGPDLRPDIGRDLQPDLGRDLAPDVGPDTPPDTPPDVSPDTSTLLSGLLAYYKCESAVGTTLQDSSGKGNHGTLAATATSGYAFQAGKVGKALALASAGQGHVSLPPAVFANATTITIAAWVSVTTSQNWARVFDLGINANLTNNTETGTRYMNLVPKNEGTDMAFAITTDGYTNEQKLTSAALATGSWKHVAVVLGSGPGGLYVDGALAAGGSAVSLRPRDLGAIDYVFLGRSQFGADPYFDGLLDEVRVYNRALSAAEIGELYQYAEP